MSKVTKKWLKYLSLVLVGMLLVVGIRFFTYKSNNVHYHANFAVYINGQREMFQGPSYYEEIQACTANNNNNPKSRVHMHDNNPGLVHVHANGVTWANFFENLGWSLSDVALVSRNGDVYENQKPNGPWLKFWLNGKQVYTIANQVIKSEDRLLINYSSDTVAYNSDDPVALKLFESVPSDAHKANAEHDPATCSGNEELTFSGRLKKALLVGQN